MLNINQNFDLKAPVFNFDRDYFNSLEELEAYDTNNVPNHFVTNVAGTLYQFTDGKWRRMINTEPREYDPDVNGYNLFLGSNRAKIQYLSENSEVTDPNQAEMVDLVVEGDRGSTSVNENSIMLYSHTSSVYLTNDPKLELYKPKKGTITASFDYSNLKYPQIMIQDSTAMKTVMYSDGFIIGYGRSYRAEFSNNYAQWFYDDHCAIKIDANNYRLGIGGTVTTPKFAITAKDTTKGATITGVESITAFSNPSATKVWATDGSVVDLPTYTNYFNGTTTADKLKTKAVEVTDNTNSVTVSPTGITATNGSNTKVFATDGSIADLSTKANASDLDAKANKSDVLLKKSDSGGYYIEANNKKLGNGAFATNDMCTASGDYSHAEGTSVSSGSASHAEGASTEASGMGSHAEGVRNVIDKNAIHSVGIGEILERKNAEYIYVKNNDDGTAFVDDPKNGYKYLIGVGGYDGISTDNTTYKSVQEVIADLIARIEQLEKLVANCVSISNVEQ